ncbi:MAG TPA: hypothetical protein VFX30_05340 [bacterium]|nr:hypothetical protein [bacterium]
MFLNVSLWALTRALLMNPVQSLRALPEAYRSDPEAFTGLPGVIGERLWLEFQEARDQFLVSDPVKALRNILRR